MHKLRHVRRREGGGRVKRGETGTGTGRCCEWNCQVHSYALESTE